MTRANPAFRRVRQGGSLLLTGSLMLGVLVLINVIASRRTVRADLTSGHRYSLSPQSRQLVAGTPGEIQLLAFLPLADPQQNDLRRLFEQYRSAAPKLRFEFIDPDQRPGEAARWGMNEYGVLVVTDRGREKARALTEEGITNAILRARRERPTRMAFLSGHDEPAPFGNAPGELGAATKALGDAGFKVRRVPLAAVGEVPDTIDAVIIVGPRADLLPGEYDVLDQFIRRGGRVGVLLEAPPQGAGLTGWLASWGAVVGDDRIVDPSAARLVGLDQFTPVVTRYESAPITRDFRLATYFRLARSVDLPAELPHGARGWVLFRSSGSAWAETSPDQMPPRLDAPADRLGPIPMAVAVERGDAGGGRLFVFGDASFITNRDWRLPGNGDLFLNAVAWLTERGDEISVRAPAVVERRVEMNNRQARGVFVLGVIGLPLLVIAGGLWTGWRRRGL